MLTEKEKALHFIESLPDDLSTDDVDNQLFYRRAVRKVVEQGMMEKQAGLMISHDELKRRLGIK